MTRCTQCMYSTSCLPTVHSEMSILFEPTKVKNLELPNRFVRSATYDALADRAGHVSDKQIELFMQLAEGGVGLIVAGIAYVHYTGCLSTRQNSIATDDCIPGYRKLTDAVHQRGAKIALQLFHAGRESSSFLKAKRKELAVGPSVVTNDPYFAEECRPVTEDEVWTIIHAFGDAARRAGEAGFDAVQVHAAHAYLLSQFLSPSTNRREDNWGGSLENRLRLHREVYRDIRAKVGKDYPVLIKLGVEDGFPGGLKFSEGKQAAQLLAQDGFDALEISQGLRGEKYSGFEFRPGITNVDREAYFGHWCKEIKSQVKVPTMMVGGLRTFELMEQIIQKGEADFVSLSRPLIREPDLINRWKTDSHYKPACISCNQCFDVLLRGQTLVCRQRQLEEQGHTNGQRN